MKKSILFIAFCSLLAACSITITNHGDDIDYGDAVSREYPLTSSYSKLEVSHAFNVVMCDTVSVPRVTIAEELHKKLVFRVSNGTLQIGLKPSVSGNIGHAEVLLPTNSKLDAIELSGASGFSSEKPLVGKSAKIELSGAVTCQVDIKSKDIEMAICGASHYNGNIKGDRAEIELSGASTTIVTGSLDVLDLEVAGASHLDASQLNAQNVEGDINGASTVEVRCCDKIDVEVSGASHLTYGTVSGNCHPRVNCETSGFSSVTAL